MNATPPRFYCLGDDEAGLWERGQTGDDLGTDEIGRHRLKFDHYDDVVVIANPYGRGLIRRLPEQEGGAGGGEASAPPGYSDAELDAYLDKLDQEEERNG